MYPNNFRPSVKHVLGVLEWFYMLTEKILFQNRGLVFYYPSGYKVLYAPFQELFAGISDSEVFTHFAEWQAL